MPPQDTQTIGDDTNETRMSFGDHLEELRRRVVLAIVGLILAATICFLFGDKIIEILTTPYCVAMEQLGFDPRMVQLNPLESFIEYFKITLKFGLVLSAPWVIYQLWLFVAKGLFPSEQRLIRTFAPASIFLFVLGSSFMVAIVLSGLLKFLITMSTWFPLPSHDNFLYRFYQPDDGQAVTATQPTAPPIEVPLLGRDPEEPTEGQIWFNTKTQHLNLYGDQQTYSTRLQRSDSRQFVQPFFSISEYLGFVVNLALAFGLGFQIPIVVVFLIAMRIIAAAAISKSRKYVVLGVFIAAAIITPTPDVGTMLLLAVPMLLLFEIGLIIGRMIERRAAGAPGE